MRLITAGLHVEEAPSQGSSYVQRSRGSSDEACAQIVARAPVSFGQVARYGFVADPDGNWIEISARTSLTGKPVAAYSPVAGSNKASVCASRRSFV